MTTYHFGKKSLAKLADCHPDLMDVAQAAIRVTPMDFTIVWGYRNKDIQDALFASHASKKHWPNSKHNYRKNNIIACSKAIDFAPWINGSIPWKDTHAFAIIAGVWFSAAIEQNIKLRWGGDWDMDGLTIDQTFMDYGHIELC